MSNPFTFGTSVKEVRNKYAKIGFSRNPFTPRDEDDNDGPFYQGHLSTEISTINKWLQESINDNPPALSIKGSIGVGKTRLMKAVRNQILSAASQERVHAGLIPLGQSGYARPSIGQLMLDTLETYVPAWMPSHQIWKPGIIPLVKLIVESEQSISRSLPLGQVLGSIRDSPKDTQEEKMRLFCRWIHREQLTPKQSEQVGLYHRLDYEGALPGVLCDLLILAKEAGVLNKLYLMIDQLEDLFRPSYSELRQSRLVTDMRLIIDKQDAGAPLGLIFAWSPDVDQLGYSSRNAVDHNMQQKYSALYSRLTRSLVNIGKLRELHIAAFAEAYTEPFKEQSGNDTSKWPAAVEIAGDAWSILKNKGVVQDNTVTPRDLLTALYEAVEARTDTP